MSKSVLVRLLVVASVKISLGQNTSALQPAAVMNVKDCLQSTVSLTGVDSGVADFAVQGSGIFYLVYPGPSQSPLVIYTDHSGKCGGSVTVPTALKPGLRLAVGSNGVFAVNWQERASKAAPIQRLALYKNLTDSGAMFTLPTPLSRPVMVGTRVVGIDSRKHTLVQWDASKATQISEVPIPIQYPGFYAVSTIGSNQIAILELAHSRLHIVSLQDGATRSVPIVSEQLDKALQKIPVEKRWSTAISKGNRVRETASWGMAASAVGRVFVALSGFRLAWSFALFE